MTLGLKKISSFPLQLYCHCQQSTGCKNIIKVQLRPFLGRKLSWKIAAHSSEKVFFFHTFMRVRSSDTFLSNQLFTSLWTGHVTTLRV